MTTGNLLVSSNNVGADVEWTIPNFFSLPEEDGSWSPVFSFSDQIWRFRIWPNDWRLSDSHVVLYICRYSSGPTTKLELSVSLKTEAGEKEFEVRCARVFEEHNQETSLRFLSRSEISRRRLELVPHGALTLLCTLKNKTSIENPSITSSATAECCYCKGAFGTGSLPSHQKRCWSRPVKCPDCLEDVLYQKWLDEHECRIESTKPEEEGELKENPNNAGVDASTQTEEGADDGSLCQDFKKVLLEGLDHDIILRVDDKNLRAHRDVLRARSQVFQSMLSHDMVEKNSGVIDIPDCDPMAMEQFLSYVYSGAVEMLDQSNMLNLYYIADKYDMKGLKKDCSDFVKESLSQTNVCDVIQLALNHSDSSLLDSATVYFMDNMLGIMRTVEWQVFMKDNSTVANELMIKSVEKSNHVKS